MLSGREVVFHGREEDALFVDAVDLFSGLVFTLPAFERYGVCDLVCDARAGGSGAVHDDAQVGQGEVGDFAGGVEGGEGDAAGSLHVVVEAGDFVRVLVEDASRVGQAEVFEVDQRFRVAFARGADEAVDEGVVFLAADAWALEAEVELVVEELVVVGAGVEDYGKGAAGVDAGAESVDN